jgi:BirA family biotin operon repressor/biotin-[acetyl-CoA-carboxylase] ligase
VSALGRPRVHLRSTDSTNDRARQLAMAGAPHGRGRQGRRWSAPAGQSLLMSLVLHSPPPLLPLLAAVAVCDVAGKGAAIKWPNDIVLVHARALAKLGGILAEGRPQAGWTVLGVGLNVAVRLDELPVELRASATTLGHSPDAIEPTLERLLAALERRLAEPASATLAAWRLRDALYGREIVWNSGRGRAEGIDGTGRLIVALADGAHTSLDAGEVHLEPVG